MTHLPARVEPPTANRRGALRFSESLQDSKKGETVLVNADGAVMTRWGRRKLALVHALKVGGAVGLPLGVLMSVVPPPWNLPVTGALYVASVAFLFRIRRMAAHVLGPSQDGRPQDALREATAALQRPLLLRSQRIMFHSVAAGSCLLLGQHAASLQHADDGLRCAGTRQKHRASRALLEALRANALVELGRVGEAEALLHRLRLGPTGEVFRLNLVDLELRLAFGRNTVDGLAVDLHDAARTVLGSNRFGSTAGLLAWAFLASGDGEMARLLLAEAFQRLGVERVETSRPTLFRWMTGQAAEWGIDVPPTEGTA